MEWKEVMGIKSLVPRCAERAGATNRPEQLFDFNFFANTWQLSLTRLAFICKNVCCDIDGTGGSITLHERLSLFTMERRNNATLLSYDAVDEIFKVAKLWIKSFP